MFSVGTDQVCSRGFRLGKVTRKAIRFKSFVAYRHSSLFLFVFFITHQLLFVFRRSFAFGMGLEESEVILSKVQCSPGGYMAMEMAVATQTLQEEKIVNRKILEIGAASIFGKRMNELFSPLGFLRIICLLLPKIF